MIMAALSAPTAMPLSAQTAPALQPSTKIKVQLKTKLDTKKSKVGDKVEAQVKNEVKNGDTVLLPKNSLLEGTVTEVDESAHGSSGKIGVLFTEAIDKKGTVLLHLRGAIMHVIADSMDYGQLAVPTEMGGSGVPIASAGVQTGLENGWDHSSDGKPISYALMNTFNGSGTDLGGLIQSPKDNFHLDSGTQVEVQVLAGAAQ
jgi:hypothetical protein